MIPRYVFAVRIEHDVGRPLIPLTLLAGGHCAPRRLPGLTVHARAWCATGYRHHFRRMRPFIVGDWALGNPALTISCGSCGTPPWMPPDGHRVPDMLWSPSGFRRWVSQAIQEPPSEFLPAAPGIQQGASRRSAHAADRASRSVTPPHRDSGPITTISPLRHGREAASTPGRDQSRHGATDTAPHFRCGAVAVQN